VFGFAFNVFAFNYTFGPAASRRKGGQRRGTIWVIYVAAGWFGSSANPFFFKSLSHFLGRASHRRQAANAEGPSNDAPLKPTFRLHL
jgi:hypothetical protein